MDYILKNNINAHTLFTTQIGNRFTSANADDPLQGGKLDSVIGVTCPLHGVEGRQVIVGLPEMLGILWWDLGLSPP